MDCGCGYKKEPMVSLHEHKPPLLCKTCGNKRHMFVWGVTDRYYNSLTKTPIPSFRTLFVMCELCFKKAYPAKYLKLKYKGKL